MTAPGDAGEREAELAALRKRMGRAARRGDRVELERLVAVYAAAKAEHVTASHEERIAARRARRAAVRPVEPSGRWVLPAGFASPLAAERARSGVYPREEPSLPPGGLRPWRRGSPMRERIWRP
jgi:hypothetical protein